MEQALRGAKRAYERRTVDKAAFHERLMHGLAQAPPRSRWNWKRRVAAVALPLVILSSAAFGYAHVLVWGGGVFVTHREPEGPTSIAATPHFVRTVLTQPHTIIYPLSQSVLKARFPIREPRHIAGWTKVLSEGVQMPLYHEREPAQGQTQVTRMTQQPLEYLDIYDNARGQRIAVTQQYSPGLSWAYKRYHDTTHWSASEGWGFGSNYHRLSGFPGDMAWLESGTWHQIHVHEPGSFENVVILHPEANRSVTTLVVDAYGQVRPSTLESFAHAYLQAPIQ